MSTNGIGRRFFLRIAGVAGAAAACSPKHAPEKLVPLLVPPEYIVPGKVLEYRTVCRSCAAGCGVTARTREGRAVKLEGNPDDPISRGALCGRGQAAVQELYSPDRLRGPLLRGAPVSWDAAMGLLAEAIGKAKGRVALLTRPEPGAAGDVQRAFILAAGGKRVVQGDPALEPLRGASLRLFGRAELPQWELSEARSVVSFGADIAETWHSPVQLARGLASGRGRSGDSRMRYTWVGPRLSTSGLASDSWLRTRPGGERDVALLLLQFLAGALPAPEAVRPALRGFDAAAARARSGVEAGQIERLGRELVARRPSAMLGPGLQSLGPDAAELAEAVLLANFLLGNVGKTMHYGMDAAEDAPGEPDLSGVEVLLLHRVRAPAAAAKVPLVASFGERADPAAQLILPDRHALESFDTLRPRGGIVAAQQPVIAPLGDTRPAPQVLCDLAAKLQLAGVPADFRDFARSRAAEWSAGNPSLLSLGVAQVPAAPAPVELKGAAAFAAKPARAEGLSLVRFPTALPVADPDSAPWLREVPDLLSGLSWSSWAELSPAAAARAGVRDGEQLEVKAGQAQAILVARVNPGLHDEAVAIPASAPELRDVPPGAPLSVRKAGPVSALVAALAPMARGQEGRDLARAVSAAAPSLPPPPKKREMIAEPEHPRHRWGMAIDLDRCTGCQACVVACYAENNIPVNGPVFANAGRSMAWLRIQRTYEKRADGGVKLRVLPSLCQQCDAAPCEPVCPVYATYHTPDGLNAQVYNRCIGTRYCANNCPYDARVFNWRDPVFAESLQMQLNPDVSVRGKGIMEKCTFCVQRIRAGLHTAAAEGRSYGDGDVTPACAQTCPAQAIVFGDLKDPSSRASSLSAGPRGYTLLDDLNTRPAITYLARIEDET